LAMNPGHVVNHLVIHARAPTSQILDDFFGKVPSQQQNTESRSFIQNCFRGPDKYLLARSQVSVLERIFVHDVSERQRASIEKRIAFGRGSITDNLSPG